MAALLPIVFALICFAGLRRRLGGDWREVALLSALCFGVALVAITEALSLAHAIAFVPLVAVWSGAIVAAAVLGIGGRVPVPVHRGTPAPAPERLRAFDYFALFYVLFILTATGVLACVAPPNNWDSMTYHMSRVVH